MFAMNQAVDKHLIFVDLHVLGDPLHARRRTPDKGHVSLNLPRVLLALDQLRLLLPIADKLCLPLAKITTPAAARPMRSTCATRCNRLELFNTSDLGFLFISSYLLAQENHFHLGCPARASCGLCRGSKSLDKH